jgi:hypothetical protein
VHAPLRMTTLVIIFLAIGLLTGCDNPQDRGVIVGAPIPAEILDNRLDRQQHVTTSDPEGEPAKTLHIVEVTLAGDPQNANALALQQQALHELLVRAENGLRSDYEIYWLNAQLEDTEQKLNGFTP